MSCCRHAVFDCKALDYVHTVHQVGHLPVEDAAVLLCDVEGNGAELFPVDVTRLLVVSGAGAGPGPHEAGDLSRRYARGSKGRVEWDGLNKGGEQISAGIYMFEIRDSKGNHKIITGVVIR